MKHLMHYMHVNHNHAYLGVCLLFLMKFQHTSHHKAYCSSVRSIPRFVLKRTLQYNIQFWENAFAVNISHQIHQNRNSPEIHQNNTFKTFTLPCIEINSSPIVQNQGSLTYGLYDQCTTVPLIAYHRSILHVDVSWWSNAFHGPSNEKN